MVAYARYGFFADPYSCIDIAGVNMRLEAGAVREMHWHKNGEWSYIISVSAKH